ncbi:hypothetical protein Tco_0387245 [Tanacetum coccineum]
MCCDDAYLVTPRVSALAGCDIVDIYGRFVYEENLISRRYSDTKMALITTPSDAPKSSAFFSNNIVHDFQENSDDEADERSSEEYLSDLDLEFHDRALLTNSKCFIKRKSNFFSQKNNGLVAEMFDLDEEEVSDEKEETKVKVVMALADDELFVGKNHARNSEWIESP